VYCDAEKQTEQADTPKDIEIHNANIPCRSHNVDILKSKHVFDMLVIGGGYVRAYVCVCECLRIFVRMLCGVLKCVCAEF